MRKYIRDNIVEVMSTIKEGIDFASSTDMYSANAMLCDCYDGLESILDTLKNNLSPKRFEHYKKVINDLQNLLESMNMLVMKEQLISVINKEIYKKIEFFKRELQEEKEVKLEILFLPYKSSMWDSLESIWYAASKDERCNSYVMPIPYYDRNSEKKLAKLHYEGNQFPEHVEITHYKDYDIADRRPDIIYIHNPYDGYNFVTSVDPKYYSYELKKYTDMLVYVPYFIAGAYPDLQSAANKVLAPATKHVDRIIVQNELQKEIFIKCGHAPYKVIALGSPKIDSVYFMKENPPKLPEGWKEKIQDKKVILFNLTIGTVLADQGWLEKYYYYLKKATEIKNIVIIWRPHPLIEATLKSMRPHLYKEYMDLMSSMKRADNVILDYEESSDAAIYYSDGMISDYSSLIFKYMATGKPLYLFILNPKIFNKETNTFKEMIVLMNYYESYFWVYEEGVWEYSSEARERYISGEFGINPIELREFIDIVLEDKDTKQDARVEAVRQSILNADGSCGQKIHEKILATIEWRNRIV